MSDIKLFKIDNASATELDASAASIEKELQTLIENNSETCLGVRFLATEYTTGKTHGGRIDTLGIDENGCPIIIEYKRHRDENVINQGLYYLDWLLDHKAEFKLLVIEKLGQEVAESIEWSGPRLLCIAGDFTRYDEHAVQQINRNIELIRYRKFAGNLLMLELVNVVTATSSSSSKTSSSSTGGSNKTVTEYLEQADDELTERFELLRDYLLTLGDDVQLKALKFYFAFKRIKNFACVEVQPRTRNLLVYVKVDPDSVELVEGFTRDVRTIGHYGTGDLEITLSSVDDVEKCKPLLVSSYEAN